jgi:hypothetical protein
MPTKGNYKKRTIESSPTVKTLPTPNVIKKDMTTHKLEYYAIHRHLGTYYPKKLVCEHCNKPAKTHYALMKGKEHERNRDNYLELCPKCHKAYDYDPEYYKAYAEHFARLTELKEPDPMTKEIFVRWANGETMKAIGESYGITDTTVSRHIKKHARRLLADQAIDIVKVTK